MYHRLYGYFAMPLLATQFHTIPDIICDNEKFINEIIDHDVTVLNNLSKKQIKLLNMLDYCYDIPLFRILIDYGYHPELSEWWGKICECDFIFYNSLGETNITEWLKKSKYFNQELIKC